MNWNTYVISTDVTGTAEPVLSVIPAGATTLTWAFATGECGSENWAGITPAELASANVSNWVSSGKYYIISTGGADGVFTCGTDSGFATFIQTYYSSNMLGIDFDIEGGQTQDDINNLVARVQVAQSNYPNLRFSFTIATLGGDTPNSLNSLGTMVVNAIQSAGLTNYTINLMAMDYGSTSAANCTISGSSCEMGLSAIAAAENLHSYYGIPYANIELTPMIGGNDTQGETFTIADVATVSSWVLQNGLAGVHFWSFDRDNDCAPGAASPTCNSYGQAGTLGFTNAFISALGL
jgi:chitinase